MILNIDTIGITFYALVKRFTNLKKENEKKKNVLFLIHENGIGDVVCTLDVIKRIEEIYPPEESYKIYFGVDQGIYNFLKNINYTQKHQFIILNIGLEDRDKHRSFSVYLKDFKKLNALCWETIVSYKRIGPYLKLLFMGLRVNRFSLVEFAYKKNLIDLDTILNRLLKNLNMYYFNESQMLFSLYENAIAFFTQKRINLCPPVIPVLAKAPPKVGERKYCIISCGVGANHPFKYRSWPAERFAKVITFIEKELGLDVYLCGNQNDIKSTEHILKCIQNKEHVFNLVGKTDFNQWIEFTRNAEFVFGNDSGYIHVAAAVGTQAIVLIGYWNYGRFHPYQLSKGLVDYKKPILIKAKRPDCSFCSVNRLIKSNPRARIAKSFCDAEVERNNVYKCIYDISVKEVVNSIGMYYTIQYNGAVKWDPEF